MIIEVARITVDPASANAFEAAVAQAAQAFQTAEGCHGVTLERVIEHSGQYLLRVTWESVDHHMVKFRNSPNFQTWRGLAGPYFASSPVVEHTEVVKTYFSAKTTGLQA